MRTKKVVLFYEVSSSDIWPPPEESIKRKNDWIDEVKRTNAKLTDTQTIKVTYELYNKEVEYQRKFFNGPVIEYYAIQNSNILTGEVDSLTHEKYRETILSQLLGYEVELVNGKEKRRGSTSDFISTQQWHDFLERLRETLFEPEGYEMPDSDKFKELQEAHGYEQAKKITIGRLVKTIIAKNKIPND